MKIRPASRSDLQKIAAIHIASWRDTYADVLPPEFLERRIEPSLEKHWREIVIQKRDIVLVAEKASIVGFIAVWCRPVPFIDNLHVTASLRSQKVGTALMLAAADELIQQGHRAAYLWVFESNRDAIRFYERLGGVQKETAMKSIFGHDISSRKIEWVDLRAIKKNQ
jgi:ribosomal protein S18 acetylase RimI-like enzyme